MFAFRKCAILMLTVMMTKDTLKIMCHVWTFLVGGGAHINHIMVKKMFELTPPSKDYKLFSKLTTVICSLTCKPET